MILVDTNVLIALLSADDNQVVATELIDATTKDLLVPPTVVAEVCFLVGERNNDRSAEVVFLRSFTELDGLTLAELTPANTVRMADLTEQWADLGLGGTDASAIALAERLGVDHVATFDRRHFPAVRPAGRRPLTLLPVDYRSRRRHLPARGCGGVAGADGLPHLLSKAWAGHLGCRIAQNPAAPAQPVPADDTGPLSPTVAHRLTAVVQCPSSSSRSRPQPLYAGS